MAWLKKRTATSSNPIVQNPIPEPTYQNPPLWQSQQDYAEQQHVSQQYWSPGIEEQQQTYDQNPYAQPHKYQYQTQNFQSSADNYYPENVQPHSNFQYGQQHSSMVYGDQSHQGIKLETDSWEWGDEDNSNNISNLNIQYSQGQHYPKKVTQPTLNDTAKEEAWNWSIDDPVNSEANQYQNTNVESLRMLPTNTLGANERKLGEVNSKQFPFLPAKQKGRLETPQWSIESQVSQESSDDVLHTSESDNHMLSRSSTISHSPLSGQDLYHKDDAKVLQDDEFNNQIENRQVIGNNLPNIPLLDYNLVDGSYKKPAYSYPNVKFVKSSKSVASESSHILYNQAVNLEAVPDNSEHPDSLPQSLSLPSSSAKHAQYQENSEVPMNDRNQYLETGQLSGAIFETYPDELSQSIQNDDNLPPPGLSRMVLGEQIEQTDNRNSNLNEPRLGLSRMVLGQPRVNSSTEFNSGISTENTRRFQPTESLAGFHRMVPGESSSPESSFQTQFFQRSNTSDEGEEQGFENEFNQIMTSRSATIGADTPPITNNVISSSNSANRSETIGADTPPDSDFPSIGMKGLRAASNDGRITISKKSLNLSNTEVARREIEGQIQNQETTTVTNMLRNLTVGENESEGARAIIKNRRHSRQESSDNEPEIQERSSDDRNRKFKDDYKQKSSHSSKSYRDKKYDRRQYREKRYEDDTDGYSDEEKDRYRDNRDYDRKYHSLRKEKDKKRRNDKDYDRDSRSHNYYYNRRDIDERDDSISRPSSRSDSLQEPRYRDQRYDRNRDKRNKGQTKDRHHVPREPFHPFTCSYDFYNSFNYQYQYQYYENLRRTNPQAYAEWYHKCFPHAVSHMSGYGDDRTSVHSGRSSTNNELGKDRYTQHSYYSETSLSHMGGYYRDSHSHSLLGPYDPDDTSLLQPFDQTDSSMNYGNQTLRMQRMTPTKFSTTHLKASISSGKLIKILPHYPVDGQVAAVEIVELENFLNCNEEYRELTSFPGPLVKGVTHKKTVIEYCENKIKNASHNYDLVDCESYILMWELLILLLRQNGMVVGTDIAELLLKPRTNIAKRPSSVLSNTSSNMFEQEPANHPISEVGNGSTASLIKSEEITNKFREYLLYGSCKEALEWAMKHGLWGHALFLASKLDKRTYVNVMTRFANGLTINDPLQTLYQLLSGRVPAAVTCIADEKWGDWKPHLAMILSNSTQRPEVNCKAITTLGDTLMSRGSLYSAQFCYLMAEVGFCQYGNPDAKLVLLGSDHRRPFAHFATNEAIHMTEIYEYTCSLNNSAFVLPEFQSYKYVLATRLADYGLLEKSLGYLEQTSEFIVANSTLVQPSLINNVYILADKLKFYDAEDTPQFDGNNLNTNHPDNSWLYDLHIIYDKIKTSTHCLDLQYTCGTHQIQSPPENVEQISNTIKGWSHSYSSNDFSQNVEQLQWNVQQENNHRIDQQQQIPDDSINQSYEPPQDFTWQHQQNVNAEQPQQLGQIHTSANYMPKTLSVEPHPPQISMPNQSNNRNNYDEEPSGPQKELGFTKTSTVQPDKPANTGWFGGIFSKLALKPKNQMKLPDDKNPSIVWDDNKKKWINIDEDNNESVNDFKPPPKLSEMNSQNLQTPKPEISSLPGPNNLPNNTKLPPPLNMFKLGRNRDLKKSYIDVFNPNANKGTRTANLYQPSSATTTTSQISFFTPHPVNDPNAPVDFLTPAPPLQQDETSQRNNVN